ncbi:facilitated trehalose transporter Tret1-like [Macrosteles quadrilineatus]|uniref:facilitated trehalose transporter Tret1-like n=1 Tax=Macrosteles quadrilineatus TaxID=74068 RepID=UPI0023E0C7DF|nr:facilitated trehalose transporter Tret1-like isoform X2 [Macrosteles quadrilineatus]XP_054272409.1 facilitated trehalose transporter Tret1-like isoform X2 [Macrosteles quadrilineatus]XP_054273443.1 facilitated trehalose transporter Tret1-like [Macrosteles quadrilineatus]XP_054273447.1 facilitated trehalose transporter Tret1-like [Macrosteles quadrilineatus]
MCCGLSLATLRQLYATVSACLIVVACGTSFGWIAPTLVNLTSDDSEIPMTSAEASWMIAIIEVGNLFSPIPAGLLADKFGRKPLALSTGPFYIISWLIILNFKNLAALCVARIVQGLAIGIVFTVIPMYLGEIASQHIRGGITSLFQIAFYFGFLYEYFIGPFVSFDVLVIISMLLPIVFIGLFFLQPESPHFYIMKGREDEAENSLMWLRGTTNVEDVKEELVDMIQTVQKEISNKASIGDIIATPADRRALMIVQLVGGVKMMSGLAPIVSYSTELFRRTGFTLIPPYVLTIIMGLVLFISGFFSTALTDLTGRRPLLIISTIGCAFSLGCVSLFFYYYDHSDYDLSEYTWVSPACIILYNLFLAFGLDPVSMTYRSEMFPANTRAVASSINTIVFTIGAFITLKLYQVVADSIGVYFIFMIFSLTCFVGSIWMYFYAIETKNKSLSQIQKELTRVTQTC